MLFNSFDFLLFLPLVIIAYYLINPRYRWMMLLAVSYYFYMCWRVEYVVLILISTLIDYWAGIKMGQQKEKKKRRKFLFVSLLGNLGLLFFFKYYGFFTYNTEVILSEFNIFYHFKTFDLLLPVGISFYTFQTLSYSIDVYMGKNEPEKHLGYFALYVTYFPQLVAGPIERSTRLIPQLREQPKVRYEDFRYATNKILLGFFKKVVVADTLAVYVDQIYASPEDSSGIQLAVGTIFFSVQIFCDFSGYTDIAMGSARLMGVRLMENFNRPMWVTSISEMWSKWHMSLTTWISDYIFKPLVSSGKNIAISTVFIFVIIGFWHGPKWTFIIFGFIHGFGILLQRLYKHVPLFRAFNKTWIAANFILPVFNLALFMYTSAWFRSQNVSDALTVTRKIFTDLRFSLTELFSVYKAEVLMGIFVISLLCITISFNRKLSFKYNWAYVASMLLVIIIWGQNTQNQFIYFQF